MSALSSPLRKQLETSVLAARRAAESASRAAVEGMGVFDDRRPEHLTTSQAELRIGLRAKWRQLSDDRGLLIAECAYEQWHRLLFARFLAENNLLLHPQYKAPVTLLDCEDLAGELGEPDAWSVAARFAAEILPGIFRLEDPCVQLRLAPEGRQALEQILDALPAEIFLADDALGWVYQFWQKDKKDEINASERKIGGADLGPVTQLFTENYMVRFLLENSLGAWWASRHPDSSLAKGFDYLRFDDDGKPAAGSFEAWPSRVADVTVMDPCCGSGHFLVESFSMLWQMRAEEESLSPVDAQDAVLRDNLFGLEIDPRCVQIAMFAVASHTWKAGGGWRQLPVPNIACSGTPVKAPIENWTALADGDPQLEGALTRLHGLFKDAETLGSLIDPHAASRAVGTAGQATLDDVDWSSIAPLLEVAAGGEASDAATAVLGASASGMARAADLLARQYTLVTTNVPYLTRYRQSETLRDFSARYFPDAKADLSTVFVHRAMDLGCTIAVITPQAWLSLGAYQGFRRLILGSRELTLVARLGPGAFSAIGGVVVNVAMFVMHRSTIGVHVIACLDVEDSAAKASALQQSEVVVSTNRAQLKNPDARLVFGVDLSGPLVQDFADSLWGLRTADNPRFTRCFWEIPHVDNGWEYFQGSVGESRYFGGRETVVLWEKGSGALARYAELGLASIQGAGAWGRKGIAVTLSGDLPVTLYTGEKFGNSVSAVWVKRDEDLAALWHFMCSPEFAKTVRELDSKLIVTNKTLLKVPFDAERWRAVAEAAGSLPEPSSDDPTQWLFNGTPQQSTAPLHVAVARLVGYRWPEQEASDDLDAFTDADGIVCLPPVAGEAPAADRVQQLLAVAFGDGWSLANMREELERAGSRKTNLVDWLQHEFFKQHCVLFSNRPFVWHIWDGQRDGFSALVNYHRLDRKTLEKLTYTYLGQDWLERQRAEVHDGMAGAEARLSAALALQGKLKTILEGEAPYDVYVRWKENHEQPIGWEPDLNDGVRFNVRPFVEAGVLRSPFTVHWRKDRGKNPDGSERENDVHLTLAEKRDARTQAGHR